jgi:hypothetical protein
MYIFIADSTKISIIANMISTPWSGNEKNECTRGIRLKAPWISGN